LLSLLVRFTSQAINRGAEVIECQNAQVDLDKILGITAFSLDRLLEADPDFLVRTLRRWGMGRIEACKHTPAT
jgi:G3E family GTPase